MLKFAQNHISPARKNWGNCYVLYLLFITIFIIILFSLEDGTYHIIELYPNQYVDIVHIRLRLEFLSTITITFFSFTKFRGDVFLLKTGNGFCLRHNCVGFPAYYNLCSHVLLKYVERVTIL